MEYVVDHIIFYKALAQRVRRMRLRKNYTVEDMGYFGVSTRHWQQIEKGRPITGRTILRICDAFRTSMPSLLRGFDRGIYKHEAISPFLLKKLAARATLKRTRLSFPRTSAWERS
jgi:transcriptional regulator with XRE-family HTH domain